MKRLAILSLTLLFVLDVSATHIRGGYIQYEKISGNTVLVRFIGYRDVEGVPFSSGILNFGDGNTYGGEGGESISWDDIIDLGNGIEQWSFSVVHTYSNAGNFKVSYSEDFRTVNIVNIPSSVSTTFYVESLISLDPVIQNTQPSFRSFTSFRAIKGETYVANFSSDDNDADSLSYHLISPLISIEESVPGYLFPSNPTLGESTFSLDPISANLVWNEPSLEGLYTVALKIVEWRKIGGNSMIVGSTVQDFVIEVIEGDGLIEIVGEEKICYDPLENYNQQLLIENQSKEGISIRLYSSVDSLKVDGLPIQDWNVENEENLFTADNLNLSITLDQIFSNEYRGINDLVIEITGGVNNVNSRDGSVTYSINFPFGFGCDEDSLIILDTPSDDVSFQISANKIQIHNYSSESYYRLYDLSGNELEKGTVFKTKGTINYPFEKNTVYLILVENSSSKIIEKFIIKED